MHSTINSLWLIFFLLMLLAGCEEKREGAKGGSGLAETTDRVLAYARFVPERKDDFAWENDRIAFRMYGPALEAAGEISGGIDVWVKSTRQLILDKWYRSEDYHRDHGEGLDYYKVGPSLGCGGPALIEKGELNKSGNFVSWKILENGPQRVTFQLSYAPRPYKDYDAVGETRKISLHAGENLNRIEVQYSTPREQAIFSPAVFKSAIGVVKHTGADSGKTFFDRKRGLFAYWEPTHPEHGNTMVGVLVDPDKIDYFTETDEHYLIVLKDTSGDSFVYYAGASWSKSGDFRNMTEWLDYLKSFKPEAN